MANNYKPVALPPMASRILDHFVKQQITKYLTTENCFQEASLLIDIIVQQKTGTVVLAVNKWLTAKAEH